MAVALALLVLSGCGSDNGVADKSAQEILSATKQAATGASSVHVVANLAQGRVGFKANLRLSRGGGRGKVSFLGLDFEVVRIADSVYIKGNPVFYKRLEATLGVPVKVPRGMWLKASVGRLAQLAAFTDLRGELTRILSTPGVLTKGATTTVNGQQAIEVKEATKVYKGVLYVATTGKPYPVALLKSKGKAKNEREAGKSTFSEWDRPVSLSAPSPWVDVETLKK